jgi:hypothetical protein
MKNCIVLSGHYRTFDTTWENIKSFIDLNQLDVYCHLWSVDDTEESDRQLQSIIDKLELKSNRILRESPDDYKQKFKDIENRVKQINPKPNLIIQDKIWSTASMHYSRKAAYDLVKENYDNLVYCRYDILFDKIFKFENVDCILTPEAECYNLMSDIFAIMPFNMAKNYFVFNEFERLLSTQFEPEFEEWLNVVHKYGEHNIRIHKYHSYNTHMMLLRHFIMSKTPYKILNIPVRIR